MSGSAKNEGVASSPGQKGRVPPYRPSRGPGPCVAEVVGMAVATTCWVHGHGHLTVHSGPRHLYQGTPAPHFTLGPRFSLL